MMWLDVIAARVYSQGFLDKLLLHCSKHCPGNDNDPNLSSVEQTSELASEAAASESCAKSPYSKKNGFAKIGVRTMGTEFQSPKSRFG